MSVIASYDVVTKEGTPYKKSADSSAEVDKLEKQGWTNSGKKDDHGRPIMQKPGTPQRQHVHSDYDRRQAEKHGWKYQSTQHYETNS